MIHVALLENINKERKILFIKREWGLAKFFEVVLRTVLHSVHGALHVIPALCGAHLVILGRAG
jgi:hypothetical protein